MSSAFSDIPQFQCHFRGSTQSEPLYTCAGHTSQVTSVVFSANGKLFLSGGLDGVVILWDTNTGEDLFRISDVFGGAISTLVWIEDPVEDSRYPSFCYGNASGHLVLCDYVETQRVYRCISRKVAHTHAVEEIKYDSNHGRIGSVGGGEVKLWMIESFGTLRQVLQEPPHQEFLARSLHFIENGEAILVCYLESHEIMCYGLTPWEHRWTKVVDSRIGYSTVSPNGKDVYICNLHNGVDHYTIPHLSLVRSFPQPIYDNVPLQMATAFSGELLVVGGDRGIVRVFSAATGNLVNSLYHDLTEQDRVQAVAAHTMNDSTMWVITASDTIKVWCGTTKEEKHEPSPEPVLTPPAHASVTRTKNRSGAVVLAITVLLTAVSTLFLMAFFLWYRGLLDIPAEWDNVIDAGYERMVTSLSIVADNTAVGVAKK